MSRKPMDLTGKTFGHLKVEGFAYKDNGCYYWRCRCTCGNETIVYAGNLRSKTNPTSSCGCKSARSSGPTHGRYKHGKSGSRTYDAFTNMLMAAKRSNTQVFLRWLKDKGFENFVEDMGEAPESMTLDRFPDPDGSYDPANLRWAPVKTAAATMRRRAKLFEFQGQSLSLVDWECKTGFAVRERIRRGWTLEAALTEPRGSRGKPA